MPPIMFPFLLVLALRMGLFLCCRALLLPILFGEAQHASLDPSSPPSSPHKRSRTNDEIYRMGSRSATGADGGAGLPSPVSARRGTSSGLPGSTGPSAISALSRSALSTASTLSTSLDTTSDVSSAANAASKLLGALKASILPGTDIHALTSLLFALSFEEATMLFALVLIEALGWLPRSALVGNWKWSLIAVLALSIVVVRE